MVSIGSILSSSTPFVTHYLGNPGLYFYLVAAIILVFISDDACLLIVTDSVNREDCDNRYNFVLSLRELNLGT